MKKITLIFIIGILLVGTLTALIGLGTQTKQNSVLSQKGINSYDIGELNCPESFGTCEPVKLKIDGVVNKEWQPNNYWNNCTSFDNETGHCMTWEKILFTDGELLDMRNKWEDSVITSAEGYLTKQNEVYEKRINEKTVSITNK